MASIIDCYLKTVIFCHQIASAHKKTPSLFTNTELVNRNDWILVVTIRRTTVNVAAPLTFQM